MIVCSLDLMNGKAVQLERGERLVLEREDVLELAARFGRLGEIAVIDLDAALGRGENRELIEGICSIAQCRVGGGIRDAERAKQYLRAGAQSVILGTAATPEILRALPKRRTLVALDARNGKVATNGWRTTIDRSPAERARELAPYCGGFLYTDIEREGMLGGLNIAAARELRKTIDLPLTVAGGIRSIDEIVQLDRAGIDAQVGMAIYTGAIDPIEATVALVNFAPDGLVPTIVCDAEGGQVRMLAYSNRASLTSALQSGAGIFWSRSRRKPWRKGETSENTQELVSIALDCDRDAIIFNVRQKGPTCHSGDSRCFSGETFGWHDLTERIEVRAKAAKPESYTARLLSEPGLLDAKLREEADEVARATTRSEIAWECADVLYFLSVKMQQNGVAIEDVMAQLAARAIDA